MCSHAKCLDSWGCGCYLLLLALLLGVILSGQLSISRSFPSCHRHPPRNRERDHSLNSFPVHSLARRSHSQGWVACVEMGKAHLLPFSREMGRGVLLSSR